jgi:hypothetical protein
MKHLKIYEAFDVFKDKLDELQDFCDTYLAYMTDKGVVLTVTPNTRLSSTIFVLSIRSVESTDFEWNDIKDYFIPFLEVLTKKIGRGNFMTNSDKNHEFKFTNSLGILYLSLEDVIADKIANPSYRLTIESLKFSIKYY